MTPGDRLLNLLKTRGPSAAADLALLVGLTGEAVRQQLTRLAAEDLVEATAEARGVGRPRQIWRMTAAGDARFPDAHAELAAALIRSVRTELGEDALERLITSRETDTKKAYARALSGLEDLGTRVATLTALRDREGYMAECRPEGDGWLLIENHCPIWAATTACQNFCRSELRTFAEVLGPDVRIERTEHIGAGARRCAYRITHVA